MAFLRTLYALIWSLCLKTKRQKYFMYLRLSIPFFVLVTIISTRIVAGPPRKIGRIDFLPFDPSNLDHIRKKYNKIAILPDIPQVRLDIAPRFSDFLFGKFNITTRIRSSQEMRELDIIFFMKRYLCLVEIFENLEYKGNLGAYIRFPPHLRSTSDNKNVSLRNVWRTNYITKMLEEYNVTSPIVDHYTNLPGYYEEGFLGVVDTFWKAGFERTEQTYNMANDGFFPNRSDKGYIKIQMKGFPRLSGTYDIYYLYMNSYFSSFVVFNFMMSLIIIMYDISSFKSSLIRFFYHMMGVSYSCYASSWAIYTAASLVVSVLLTLFACKISTPYSDAVFPKSNYIILVIFLCMYSLSIASVTAAFAELFDSGRLAVGFGGIYYIVSLMPLDVTIASFKSFYLQDHIIPMLFPNTAMGYGILIIFFLERYNEGITFSNMLAYTPEVQVSMTYILLCFAIQALFFLTLTFYLGRLNLSNYGMKRKWNYVFKMNIPGSQTSLNILTDIQNFENVSDKKVMFQIRNLDHKINNKNILQNINLDFYEHEITCILGENGCGKTIFLLILTGLLQATSGEIHVNGTNLLEGYEKLDVTYGFCPQKPILSDDLTVYEQMYLICLIRNMSKSDSKQEIDKYLEMFKLKEESHVLLKVCSDGVRKKVQIILAFISDPDIIILDDPGSGLDATSKVAVTSLILEKKQTSTIIMVSYTTSEVEEISDRVLFMKEGTFISGGSIKYLNELYGLNQKLSIIRENERVSVFKISRFLREQIPVIRLNLNMGTYLQYVFPKIENTKLLSKFADKMTAHQEILGIKSFNIDNSQLDVSFDRAMFKPEDGDRPVVVSLGEFRRYRGSNLLRNQIVALFLKQYYYSKNLLIMTITKILLPTLLVYCSLMRYSVSPAYPPAIVLDITNYVDPIILASCDSSMLASNRYEALKYYIETLKIGTLIEIEGEESALDRYSDMVMEKPKLESFILLGYDFREKGDTIFFNTKMYHSSPVGLNTYYQAMFYKLTQVKFSVANYPLPQKCMEYIYSPYEGLNFFQQSSTAISLGLCFLCAMILVIYATERSSGFFHMQISNEVSSFCYWMVALIWDYVTYVICVTLLLLIALYFRYAYIEDMDFIEYMFFVMLIFGIPYITDLFISSVHGGGAVEVIYSVITSMFTSSIVVILDNLADVKNASYADNFIIHTFKFLRDYDILNFLSIWFNLYTIMLRLHRISIRKLFCKSKLNICLQLDGDRSFKFINRYFCRRTVLKEYEFCTKEALFPNYFSYNKPGVGKCCMLLFVKTGFNIIMSYILSNVSFTLYFWKKRTYADPVFEESEVSKEKNMIRNSRMVALKRSALVFKNLTKYFGTKRIVNGICMKIKHGESFGLCGLNGAGTSTTFKMLTRQTIITDGIASISGYNVLHEFNYACHKAAVTPDIEAFGVPLTIRQIITIICMIRGYSYKDSQLIVEKLATGFQYNEHLDYRADVLARGTLKLISNSIVSIGDCPVHLYDNPTNGLDPCQKNKTWSTMSYYKKQGRCIVFISHNLKGLGLISDRIGIMVKGNIMSVGTYTDVSQNYKTGIYILIQYEEQATNAQIREIEHYIFEYFPKAVMKPTTLIYSLYFYVITTTLTGLEQETILRNAKKQFAIRDIFIDNANLLSFFNHCYEIIAAANVCKSLRGTIILYFNSQIT